jgi:hypothetical protein
MSPHPVSQGRGTTSMNPDLMEPRIFRSQETSKGPPHPWANPRVGKWGLLLRWLLWSYSVLIFSSFSRLAAMDWRTELVPLIHVPPSWRRESRTSSVTVP